MIFLYLTYDTSDTVKRGQIVNVFKFQLVKYTQG